MNSARILIVEDDADHGRSLLEAIGDLGVETELVATGKAGVESYRSTGADVVLSDLVLPETVAEMLTRGPGARGLAQVIEVPGCGHAPALNVPAHYALVDAFLARAEQAV